MQPLKKAPYIIQTVKHFEIQGNKNIYMLNSKIKLIKSMKWIKNMQKN